MIIRQIIDKCRILSKWTNIDMNIIWKYAGKPRKSLHKIRAYDRYNLFESYMGHATLF